MVAALGDLHVGEVARRGQHARREVVVEVRLRRRGARLQPLASRHDIVELVGADDGIHFGEFLEDVAAVPLHQATRHDQAAGAAGFLVRGHLQDGIDGLLLGRVDEAAGVDHQHVGVAGMRRQLVAAGHQLAHHDFAIDEVFGTTQADETDFQARTQMEEMHSG